MMNSQKTISDACRICMKQLRHVKFDIFKKTTELLQLLDIYRFLDINETDGLSKYLCKVCHRKIKDIYDFRKMCLESKRKYQEILNQTIGNEVKIEIIDVKLETDLQIIAEAETNENISVNEHDDLLDNIKVEECAESNETCIGLCEIENRRPQRSKRKVTYNESDEENEYLIKNVSSISENDNRKENITNFPNEESRNKDTEINALKCHICEKKFYKKTTYDLHLSKHQKTDASPQEISLKNQETKDSDEEPQVSSGNTEQSENAIMLKEDIESNKSDKDETVASLKIIIDCEYCHKTHKTLQKQEDCIKRHCNIRTHICTICDKAFAAKQLLYKHKYYQHSEGPETIKCSFEGCNKTFKNELLLKAHKRYHIKKPSTSSTSPARIFVCEDCGKSYKSHSLLKQHAFKHTGECPFKCERCPNLPFFSRAALDEHYRRHEGIKDVSCDSCDYKCVTVKQLRAHIYAHHTKDREKFRCSYCDFETYTKSVRKRHEDVVHLNIRKYKCSHCDRTFGKSHQMKNHQKTHTGERPLQCSLCPKRFIQSQALKVHLKSHARGTVRSSKEDKKS